MSKTISFKGTDFFDIDASSVSENDVTFNLDFPEADRFVTQLQLTFNDSTMSIFNPRQFHFHAPSEHTIDGELIDAEVHFVHTNNKQGAPESFGAVLGVFF